MMSIFPRFFRFTKRNVWFILGPAGAGKSTFSKYLAHRKNWLHLEIDQFSINERGTCIYDEEGIAIHGLRRKWDLFYKEKEGKPIVRKIRQKYGTAKKDGAVLSFPSTIVK
ncbi:MAG: hypothetical protein HY709_05110 [Candidatus Latescibacteria bacterium]|nr:hypothetical protein [Candidatus Latescibacterota bacterium]